jgi:hypothetical protein
MWKTHVGQRYAKLERARPYALNNDAKRFLVWLWVACERLAPDEPAKLFEWALEKLADEAGVNVLQPAVPNELTPRERWKDIWGTPLPNPYAKGQSLVQQRDPELAKWLKAFATDPYGAATSWADAESKLLKQKALTYDADTHAINPYANGANETDKATFVRNADKATVERCKWEAKPVTFPHAKDFDLTQQSKIVSVPRLSALWNGMTESEHEYIVAEKLALRQQREQAEARLKQLEAASAIPTPPRLAQRAKVGME